jgi:hypothetical protein
MSTQPETFVQARVAEAEIAHVFPLESARSSNISAVLALVVIFPIALLVSGAAVAVLLQIFSSWWTVLGAAARFTETTS